MSAPDLPVVAADSSMLTLKFGREIANYFSGSPLNRLSFLRSNHEFLQAAFSHPSAAFLVMNKLNPLVTADSQNLAFVSSTDVVPFTGPVPFLKPEKEMVENFNSDETQPLILFLGVDDKNQMPPHGGPGIEPFRFKEYLGNPYFAVDVTPQGTLTEPANKVISALKEKGLLFYDKAPRHTGLPAQQAALYAQARALLDWNARNPFCAQCGQRTLAVEAGTKRVCPPTDRAGGEVRERSACATRGTISNICFPRTDPTVIMAVLSADGTKMLLGRQRRWPRDWFSTLAGFLEPGESIEEAVRREVWEESGVRVGRVVIHSSQPWPFPNSLMIGAVGQALPGEGEEIHLGHDPELETAKWFTLSEVQEALSTRTAFLGEPLPEGAKEGELRVPPPTAVAHQLMKAVVDGWWQVSKI
ncbi:hypothetical protein VTK73DRAFT_893 [Phialemonium thermophilum]|uniref:NAD(+) diphosphatase n=1 Tax=Phialemonium thermophilum TaxID=223376 RepID=A0ABR3Y3Z5_9PEZI